MLFANRIEAGKLLAKALIKYKKNSDAIILGLPRGGVVVAYEVAKELQLPLDITCPRKIGAPFSLEYAIGAITETGEGIFNDEVIRRYDISKEYLHDAIETEKQKARHRLDIFRKGLPPRVLKGKTVILIDDGLATGFTMKAAIQSVKSEGAKKIVVAVPVAPSDTVEELEPMVDELIVLSTPMYFQAIGQFYRDFTQVEDEEVEQIMKKELGI